MIARGSQAVAAAARTAGRRVAVHVKVDAGLGRLGVRLDEAAAFAAGGAGPSRTRARRHLHPHPVQRWRGEAWSRRRMAAFAAMVAAIEAEHGIRIRYAQGAASSVLARAFPDPLNTIAPGHLMFGLYPIGGERAETCRLPQGAGLRARAADPRRPAPQGRRPLWQRAGRSCRRWHCRHHPVRHGQRLSPGGAGNVAHMLCHGRRCPVLGVSAEYTVIDLTAMPAAKVGDTVTIIGDDGGATIAAEDIASDLGAPSAAYWMVGLKSVPITYRARSGADLERVRSLTCGIRKSRLPGCLRGMRRRTAVHILAICQLPFMLADRVSGRTWSGQTPAQIRAMSAQGVSRCSIRSPGSRAS